MFHCFFDQINAALAAIHTERVFVLEKRKTRALEWGTNGMEKLILQYVNDPLVSIGDVFEKHSEY